MTKKTLYRIILFLILLFLAERFYLIPYNVNLDMQPTGKRSAVYLAKTISNKANCDYGLSLFEEVFGIDKPGDFACAINRAGFTIFIFYNKQEKKDFLTSKNHIKKGNRLYTPCFKEGNYYMICENPSFGRSRYTDEPSLPGKILYNRFPGKDMEY